jgi:purine-binding chemotaxis protein CheW
MQFDVLQTRISSADSADQFLTFIIGQEEYGIEILKVQEIRGFSPTTPIPNAPQYVRGVMNLRGTIIPVLDLRSRFGLERVEYNRFNVIIVVTIGTKVVGLLVDAVSDVLTIPRTEIQAPPDFGGSAETRIIKGLAQANDKVLMLLDIDHVLSSTEDLQAVHAAASQFLSSSAT